MKAWEIVYNITQNAKPKILTEEEQTWDNANDIAKYVDFNTRLMWESHVPGSYAPESIMIAAVQSKENMGYIVENSEELINRGLEAYRKNDIIELNKVSSLLWNKINNAKIDNNSSYHKFYKYKTFEEYKNKVSFKKYNVDINDEELLNKIYSGWLAQIVGGAFGTAMEGYTTKMIKDTLGYVNDYIREPNTFNDDITFEIAFLKAYKKAGKKITSTDIALEWIGRVPTGWSAEDIALRNIRYGILPPESGETNNPFSDWIGAQMRGAICGMVSYGNPEEAARLAWIDGCVSHSNNGIIGEVFNSMLVSMSFVENDMKKILDEIMLMIPSDSEYYQFANKALKFCKSNENWEEAWKECEKEFVEYNWIHAYPNVMAEIVALYYGDNNFDKTMHIIGMCGQDVDCNAAQIMTAIAIMNGIECISNKWTDKIGDRLDTYIRELKVMSIKELSKETFDSIKNSN